MITVKSLDFAYGKRSKLFENLDLDIASGHIYGLLGKNGSGKSTLLNLIAGVLFPRKGTIMVENKIPGKRSLDFLQEIFLVPEEFYVPEVSPQVYANLYADFYPHFNRNEYYNYLDEFEIDRSHKLTKMSMGQRKKAFIAFALACNTSLLIMDEPTNGLDIPSKTQFRKLMASISSEEKCIVISTHQVRDLENLIDTVLILDRYQIVFNQQMDEISDRMSFLLYNKSDKPSGILYEETEILGGKAIMENKTGQASRVDMELLFNAMISDNCSSLRNLFSK